MSNPSAVYWSRFTSEQTVHSVYQMCVSEPAASASDVMLPRL